MSDSLFFIFPARLDTDIDINSVLGSTKSSGITDGSTNRFGELSFGPELISALQKDKFLIHDHPDGRGFTFEGYDGVKIEVNPMFATALKGVLPNGNVVREDNLFDYFNVIQVDSTIKLNGFDIHQIDFAHHVGWGRLFFQFRGAFPYDPTDFKPTRTLELFTSAFSSEFSWCWSRY
ncbi:MAG: hypothetical protein SFY70_00260 [Bacteroidia bacterium]|nr:hypothetical protein [Bacteroidia bacterium]